MAYTTIDRPTDYFRTKIYSGTGSNAAITFDETDNSMQPDLLWGKCRGSGETNKRHVLTDSVRGINSQLASNTDAVETTYTNSFTAFGSNGFSVGDDNGVNENSNTFVAWCWKAGTAFTNDASATGIGSIDSSGSVNETAGFSIVSYTGSGSAATVKHGLSTTPNMMIIKNRVTDSKDWQVYSPVNDPTDALALNQTDATGDSDVYWNDTAPTSSVFSVKSGATNTSGAATIGYIFSNRQGYSKFGSYTGNGNADGPFIYTGFKPAWVMIKQSNGANGWNIYDNKRNTFNVMDKFLLANSNQAEASYSVIDFLSNGIKLRNTASSFNTSGASYIYMAFAENPFVTSTSIPTTAR